MTKVLMPLPLNLPHPGRLPAGASAQSGGTVIEGRSAIDGVLVLVDQPPEPCRFTRGQCLAAPLDGLLETQPFGVRQLTKRRPHSLLRHNHCRVPLTDRDHDLFGQSDHPRFPVHPFTPTPFRPSLAPYAAPIADRLLTHPADLSLGFSGLE